MTISWFQSNGDSNISNTTNGVEDGGLRYSIPEIVKVLYPPKHHDIIGSGGGQASLQPSQQQYSRSTISSSSSITGSRDRSRFSQLLLEHGEKHLQDWAVMAYSSPSTQDLHRVIRQQNSSIGSTSSNTNTTTSSSNGITNSSSSSAAAALETQWAQSPDRSNNKSNNTANNNNNNKRSRTTTGGAPLSLKKQQQLLLKQYNKEQYPSTAMTKIDGRLHLCSRSIVFEPSDPTRGIVRCPFNKMDIPPQEFPIGEPQYESMCIAFVCYKHLVMKINNMIGPFISVILPVQFRFTFLHSSPKPFVDLCQQLFTIIHNKKFPSSSTNGTTSQQQQQQIPSNLYATPELDHLLQPMLERTFDLTQLVDVRERPLTSSSLQACLLTPLQRKPGCVVVTSERLYFQPASGVLTPSDTKATHWILQDIVAVACRYNGLRDCALELFFQYGNSVLLAFEKRRDREQVLRCLPRNTTNITERDFLIQIVQAWQNGQLDNYEYLLALNAASGRSFQDLSRYPVFPWVLSQYSTTTTTLDLTDMKNYRDLSKPVGALNEERLQYFKTRLEGMQDMEETFLYGTHYSTPGYVLYYLVRSMPEQMLCLQNGTYVFCSWDD